MESSPAGVGLNGTPSYKRIVRRRDKPRDAIRGFTKPAIRRLARRGGVKRISATIYPKMREVLRDRLKTVIGGVVVLLGHSGNLQDYDSKGRKTVKVEDIIFVLNRLGTPIYGFGCVEDTPARTIRHEIVRRGTRRV